MLHKSSNYISNNLNENLRRKTIVGKEDLLKFAHT